MDYATVNGKKYVPETYARLFYGSDTSTLGFPANTPVAEIAKRIYANGLPARGTNTDLIAHTIDAASNTAFRGTTMQPFTQGKDAGAVLWAGDGGIVVQIENVLGYNVNALLEGRVPKLGGFGGNPRFGEQEIAVLGAIAPQNIARVGVVTLDKDSGTLSVNWIDKGQRP